MIKNKYDVVILVEVKNGNPNGDPAAGNMPRTDVETDNGRITDVCLKRKIRNYCQARREYDRLVYHYSASVGANGKICVLQVYPFQSPQGIAGGILLCYRGVDYGKSRSAGQGSIL